VDCVTQLLSILRKVFMRASAPTNERESTPWRRAKAPGGTISPLFQIASVFSNRMSEDAS
jgi:hypothetical protein